MVRIDENPVHELSKLCNMIISINYDLKKTYLKYIKSQHLNKPPSQCLRHIELVNGEHTLASKIQTKKIPRSISRSPLAGADDDVRGQSQRACATACCVCVFTIVLGDYVCATVHVVPGVFFWRVIFRVCCRYRTVEDRETYARALCVEGWGGGTNCFFTNSSTNRLENTTANLTRLPFQ